MSEIGGKRSECCCAPQTVLLNSYTLTKSIYANYFNLYIEIKVEIKIIFNWFQMITL